MTAYATATEMKAVFSNLDLSGVAANGVTHEELFTTLLERASRTIDLYTGRDPNAYAVTTSEVRTFVGIEREFTIIDSIATNPDLIETSADGITWQVLDSTDYRYTVAKPPYMILLAAGNITTWPRFVRITGKFGYSVAIPEPIRQATIIQAARWFKRGQMAYQDRVSIVDGNVIAGYVDKMDNDLAAILAAYRVQAI